MKPRKKNGNQAREKLEKKTIPRAKRLCVSKLQTTRIV